MLAFAYLGFRPQQEVMMECEASLGMCIANQQILDQNHDDSISSKPKDVARGSLSRGNIDKLLPQHLANSLWSMAKMRWCPSPTYLQGYMQLCVNFLHKFKSSELAQILLALSALRVRTSPQVLDLLCIQVRDCALKDVWTGTVPPRMYILLVLPF
jgi:hypothetical protein